MQISDFRYQKESVVRWLATLAVFALPGLSIAGAVDDILERESPPPGVVFEIVEWEDHPWFVGCQFHPEFTSTPRDGHPLFSGFIRAARKRAEAQAQ